MELVLPLLVVLVIVLLVAARAMDTDRVREYVESQGGELIEKHWAPFGKGWLGSKDERLYEVRYRDRDGNEHQATCKTSMFSGVYWTEDRIVGRADRPDASASLEAENRRLREELERLRRERT